MDRVPYFLWWDGVEVSEDELLRRLRSPDAAERALWAGRVLREAKYGDVWKYLSLEEILRDWQLIRRNLGRRRAFWDSLLDGWRRDGLLPS